MTRAPSDGNDRVESTKAAVARPLERSQRVWRRAVSLAGSHLGTDRSVVVLDLLRTADHGPSTMLHALALGRAQQRATPEDIPTRNAVRLLAGTIAWLGKPTEKDEVGPSRSAGTASERPAHVLPSRPRSRW